MNDVTKVWHPLIEHHVTRLRDRHTCPADFRLAVGRLAVLLAYEATKDLATSPRTIETPLQVMSGSALSARIGLIPILRAGLGMVDPVLNLIPDAEVWHLGLYRDEETAEPVEYYNRLPAKQGIDVALILDPMLATGGSAGAALESLRKREIRQVKLLSVIASKHGIDVIRSKYPDTQIYVCAIDPELNSNKFIVPGLGDAGDRIFNTRPTE